MKKDDVKEKGRVMAAMDTIMRHLCDEDLIEEWLPWGVEEDDPEFNEVLAEDFDKVAATFARLVRRATAGHNYKGWLFIAPVEDGAEAAKTRDDREEFPEIAALKAGVRHADEWARAEAEARRKLEEENRRLNEVAAGLQKSRSAALADAKRLRDLVRRFADGVRNYRFASGPETDALLAEARELAGEEVAK